MEVPQNISLILGPFIGNVDEAGREATIGYANDERRKLCRPGRQVLWL
jgi:hypothetical protein